MQATDELEELRVSLERIRALLESLVVRGLRACGPDEISQLGAVAEHLEQTGAGHLAAVLSELRGRIERDDRASAQTLLEAQTNVRLLERLLTLRVVKGQYAVAIEAVKTDDHSSETDEESDVGERGA